MNKYGLIIFVFLFSKVESLEILNLKINSTSFSVIFEWETDKEADSRLYYSPYKTLLNSVYCSLMIDKELKKKHRFEVNYLPSNFKFYYYIEAVSKDGEKTKTEIKEVKTENFLRTFLIKGPIKREINLKDIKPSLPEWEFFGSTSDILNFDGYKQGLYYLSFWLYSEKVDKNRFIINTDDEISFFVNGEKIKGEKEFNFNLKKGWNLILIKKNVEQGSFFSLKYENDLEKIGFVYPVRTYPKLIQSGWGCINLSQLKEKLEELEEKYSYFDGITIRFDEEYKDISPYGGFWPFSYTVKIDYDKLKPQIEILKNLKFKRWKDNFLWVSAYLRGEDNVDWLFDENIWSIIKENFRTIAKIVKETNCKGIFLDCETPGKKTNIFTYTGYYKEKYDFESCAKKAFERGKEVIEILQEEKPDIVIISVDGSRMAGLGRSIFMYHWGNLEKTSVSPGYFYPEMKHRLFYSFLSGMISQAKGKTKIIDGEYSGHIGDTIKGPLYNTKFFVEVLPFLKEFDIKVPTCKLFLHSGIGGRANSYEAPGRERPDAGMYEKLISLFNHSYSDYIWIYWQSYTPNYGWYEYYWMSQEKKKEMEEKIKKGEIKPFTPNLIEGKPEEFFDAIRKAKQEISNEK